MAIISDADDELSIKRIVDILKIPPDYARYDAIEDPKILQRLEEWKSNALAALQELRKRARKKDSRTHYEGDCDIVSAVAAFQGRGEWLSGPIMEVSAEILRLAGDPYESLVEGILNRNIKGVFSHSPHPSLNVHTGRKLPRASGGPMASQDAYEGQTWKDQPGVGNVLLWCVQHIDRDQYERVWYLVIPPTMALLDDFEIRYKLEGINVVAAILATAPPDLLRRTGVVELLFASLQRALTFLHSPLTPELLRAALTVAVALVVCTSRQGTELRFDQLCALLSDGIIGNVWLYANQDPETIQASVDVLPLLVEALGIGTARYLKALIHQLTYPLRKTAFEPNRLSLQLASLKALQVVISACSLRMEKWKGTVVAAVAECWSTLIDAGYTGTELKKELRAVCEEMGRAVPSVGEDFERLIALDRGLFGDLCGGPVVT
ncbi:hypothetical protein FA95DRAFT_1663859 [Auriscalpium vulgare]|uniref:Uncharacterized protein n=1 Tax=Auriscalpium vulgare TaxID=40419 RepID=A0ACB8S8X8_9AGAM|nr:hypothetical protein FA95DRAFT_1663859 [Auriscalpium vulgare]